MAVDLLTVRHALTDRLVRVSADQRPHDISCPPGTVRAVFASEEEDEFLGLVTEQIINRYPLRIFADLVPRPSAPPLPADTPLESLQSLLDGEATAVAIAGEDGTFLGAVTQTSLFEALLAWHKDMQEKTHALLEQNRRLTQHLFDEQERVSRYVAHELHDEMGQYCTAIQANIQSLIETSRTTDPAIHQRCLATLKLCDHVHGTMQSMLRRLRPALLDEMGLEYALRELADTWSAAHAPIACRLELEGRLDHLSASLNIALYRIVQECLTNVARHAHATCVSIRLHGPREEAQAPLIQLEIRDDGKGFSGVPAGKGLGLMGIRERVFGLGGEVTIHGNPGKGVCIMIEMPVD